MSTANFRPDFEKGGGILPAIAQCADSGQVLMLAYMNEEAWEKTLQIGEAHYYSRSRGVLWHKGESSGNVQKIKSIRLDCDNDAILLIIEQVGGAACHTGFESCFYREYKNDQVTECCKKVFDPREVYKQ